jgi:hypothetical protein
MTSYYTINDASFQVADINIDDTETLVEAGKNIYNDLDSFWLFLFANKKINPFTLLEQSNANLEEELAGLTGLGLTNQNTGVDAIFTAGSLIFPTTANSGDTWSYGSTGEFSLTGGFALIDSYNPFSKRAVIKYVEGFTFGNNDVTYKNGLVKGKTGYELYPEAPVILTASISEELSIVNEVNYLTELNQPYVSVKSEYPLVTKSSPGSIPAYEPIGTGANNITIQTQLNTRITQIKAYVPSTIKKSAITKVIQNYEG